MYTCNNSCKQDTVSGLQRNNLFPSTKINMRMPHPLSSRTKFSSPRMRIALDNFLSILAPTVAIIENVNLTCGLHHHTRLPIDSWWRCRNLCSCLPCFPLLLPTNRTEPIRQNHRVASYETRNRRHLQSNGLKLTEGEGRFKRSSNMPSFSFPFFLSVFLALSIFIVIAIACGGRRRFRSAHPSSHN